MWEQIASNKRRSFFLIVLLAGLLVVTGYAAGEAFIPGAGAFGAVTAALVWFVMCLVSYYGGGSILLATAGARRIEHDDSPVLHNVVEEMKIASGLKRMPAVYIIDDPSPNAFATGRNPDHAAVAVTAGLLNRCSRDELQGVIAHEIAHVQNRDILLMVIAGVMVGTIVLLADVFWRMLFYGSVARRRTSRKGGGQAQLIFLLVAIVLAILAPILARLIYFACSRRREYLADASSALYTRYPEGLASALEKIASSKETLRAASRAMAPMYIVNPLKKQGMAAHDLTSTHPPISRRVQILRGMAGTGFGAYDAACRNALGRPVLPPSALEEARAVEKRRAAEEKESDVERLRRTNDLLWRLQNFLFITCACGSRLKVPPRFKGEKIRCPVCLRFHALKRSKGAK